MLTLILKTTNGCNLDCRYCSLGKKLHPVTLNLEQCTRALEYACNICEQCGERQLNILLHGGEPTIVDMEIYRKAIHWVRTRFPQLEFLVSMQTNALVVTDEILGFCEEFEVGIGISIDGSEEIHDAQRLTKKQQPSFKRVQQNIEQYLERGFAVSGLMVLTKNALNEDFRFLDYYAEKKIPLTINPLLNYGNASENSCLALEQGDYAKYLIGVFEYALHNDVTVSIAPINGIVQAILNDTNVKICTFNKGCNDQFICVDCHGDIFPCGKYADLQEFTLGNIADNECDLSAHPVLQRIKARRTVDIPQDCVQCQYYKYCNAGCSAESYINGTATPSMCADYKMLFSYFSSTGLELIKEKLLISKQYLLNLMES